MLQFENVSEIRGAVERKSKRLQLTESLQDYFALNPKAYKRSGAAAVFRDDSTADNKFSDTSSSSLSARSCGSLDSTTHVRRHRRSESSDSLDAPAHARHHSPSPAKPLFANTEKSPSGRRVRWMMDYDSSEGTIE